MKLVTDFAGQTKSTVSTTTPYLIPTLKRRVCNASQARHVHTAAKKNIGARKVKLAIGGIFRAIVPVHPTSIPSFKTGLA